MICKHDWHFIEGTERLRCARCNTETGGIDWSQVAMTTGQLAGYKLHDPRPNTIRFFHASRVSDGPDSVEVLRISSAGVWANPDVPTDDAAKKVLEALDSNIKHLLTHARQQLRDELVVMFLQAHEGAKDKHNYWHVAANKIKEHP